MKAPANYNRMEILAIAALATLAVALAWSASASAYPVSAPTAAPSEPVQKIATHGGSVPENLPVVTVRSPQPTDPGSDVLPIVLSSVALLAALGGIGFTVTGGARMRRAPQIGA